MTILFLCGVRQGAALWPCLFLIGVVSAGLSLNGGECCFFWNCCHVKRFSGYWADFDERQVGIMERRVGFDLYGLFTNHPDSPLLPIVDRFWQNVSQHCWLHDFPGSQGAILDKSALCVKNLQKELITSKIGTTLIRERL